MKLLHFVVPLTLLLGAVRTRAAETYDEAVKQVTKDYGERSQQAVDELIQARARIANEKAPRLKEMRAAEDRIIAAETQIRQLETGQEEGVERRRKLLKSIEAARKTSTYASALVRDGAKIFADGLAPGEAQQVSEPLQTLQQKLDGQPAGSSSTQPAADLADFLLARTELAVGGYIAPGRAVMANSSEAVDGTFAFIGPSAFFRPGKTGLAGAVWNSIGAVYPMNTPLTGWGAADAAAFFEGRSGAMVTDVTGGKAQRLKEIKGSAMEHLNAGGAVAYLIVAIGLLSLLLIGQKIRDLMRMNLDSPEAVQSFLAVVKLGSATEMEGSLRTLRGTTRELFAVGLRHLDQRRHVIEEHLQSTWLRQQQYYERRLPLLAVIATSAPLMGLLGTVVGMVRTFALITVFGTGNAAKLASGISQVLVATELGLIVAIPTLIAHGFLAHRINGNLALLERYALEFVTAAKGTRTRLDPREETEAMPV
jgi:biopolymer transport protein ExbB